jgi:hypothetical protein
MANHCLLCYDYPVIAKSEPFTWALYSIVKHNTCGCVFSCCCIRCRKRFQQWIVHYQAYDVVIEWVWIGNWVCVEHLQNVTTSDCRTITMKNGVFWVVALVRIDVSEEPRASFIRVTKFGELGTTQAATSNRSTLRRNTKYFFAAPGSSETSVLTRATRHNNPEDTILYCSVVHWHARRMWPTG